jgi:glycosyltransferase involved in cell wall biosynthesis
MKILLLSDTYSEHTEKWAKALADKGHQVGLFSFNKASYEWHNYANITVFFEPPQKINAESTLTKLSYLKYVSILRKIIRHFEPDILHAHYATSYGLVGALSKFHPFVLSVWGSDVYDFPTHSRLHRRVLQYNLKRADALLSTSEVMKTELQKYTTKEIVVTPFGVDTQEFAPRHLNKKEMTRIHVGTIKPIEEKYGIHDIIDAAEIIIKERGQTQYLFYLIGDGYDLDLYRHLVQERQLAAYFVITGRIPFSEVHEYHNLLDVFLNVSVNDSESFGVATVEAMASETPVIVTDVGGLMEVVAHGKYGTVIPKNNPSALAEAILRIRSEPTYYQEQAKAAREHVLRTYDWNNNLELMISEYAKLVSHKEEGKKRR